jgi:hypothetical protein
MVTDDKYDSRTALEKTTNAVNLAVESVKNTTESVAAAINDSRRSGGILDRVTRMTREAPLRSLAIALAAGLIFARRL